MAKLRASGAGALAGTLVFEHAVFGPQEAPEQRLILYTPLPESDTPAKMAALLAE